MRAVVMLSVLLCAAAFCSDGPIWSDTHLRVELHISASTTELANAVEKYVSEDLWRVNDIKVVTEKPLVKIYIIAQEWRDTNGAVFVYALSAASTSNFDHDLMVTLSNPVFTKEIVRLTDKSAGTLVSHRLQLAGPRGLRAACEKLADVIEVEDLEGTRKLLKWIRGREFDVWFKNAFAAGTQGSGIEPVRGVRLIDK